MRPPAGAPGVRTFRRARRWFAHRLGRGDGGFILLESIIAITVITIVMGAVGVEFVSGMISSSQQQAKQGAIRVADSAVEQLRSLHASDLLGGRTCPAVSAQLAAAPSVVTPWLTNMSVAVDPNYAGTDPSNPCTPPLPSSGSATATIPTTGVTQQPGNVAYTVTDYLGWCWLANGTGDCKSTQTGVRYLRAVVSVMWSGAHCAAATCSYVTSSLFSTTSDPTFQVNQALPPAPTENTPANQTVVVGDTVNLQLTVQNGTGVPPFTYAVTTGSLPGGVQLSPTGLFSGTVTGSTGSFPITVAVTDAFLRSDSTSFTWTVKPPVTATAPSAQTSTVNTAISTLTLNASGGTGGYTWADPSHSLPTGLSITGNQVTGTATAAGTYSVTLQVTDSTSHSATVTFSWTVYQKATISSLGTLSATEGSAVDTTDTYSCPGMTCTLVLTGTVPGLGLSTTATTSNNTTTSLQVTGSGTIHIAGTVQSNAVTSGTSKAYNPVLTISNPTPTSASTSSVTWTMYTAPTISAPATKVSANSATPSEPIAYSCPNGTCTIALSGTVSGLGLSNAVAATAANNTSSLTVPAGSGTIYVNGLVSGSAGTTGGKAYTPTVTITDASGVSASDSETWTVYTKPTIPSPGSVTTTRGATPSKSLAVTCKTSSCTVTVSGLPSGIGIGTSATTSTNTTTSVSLSGSATVYLSGKVSSTATQTTYPVTVTVTDSGIAVASVGLWTVN
jgi:type II secretory pathway pseudopilin PulG